MSKPEYISIQKGLHTAKPNCFRCGDCCQMIPVEISQEEADLIASRLKGLERELFLSSITQNSLAAQPLRPATLIPLTFGIGWMKAPCMFLGWETHKGHVRTHCKIYKIRPKMCRNFFCRKETKNEPLHTQKYTYKINGSESEYVKRILSELRQQRPNLRLAHI